MARRGIKRTSYHLDRIREDKGYVPGNIQVITNVENIIKYLAWVHDKNGKPAEFKFKKRTQLDEGDYPF